MPLCRALKGAAAGLHIELIDFTEVQQMCNLRFLVNHSLLLDGRFISIKMVVRTRYSAICRTLGSEVIGLSEVELIQKNLLVYMF